MTYEKKLQDVTGDVATVAALREMDGAYQRVRVDASPDVMLYTPATAREMAKALKRAANAAEGKPAQAAKPREIVDNDGDSWHLSPNGKYGLFRPEDDATSSRADIRKAHGIREERP